MNANRLKPWSSIEAPESVPDEVANDPDVRSWWSDEHDELIRQTIRAHGWYWILDADAVTAITPPKVLDDWRKRHEARSKVSWYGYLAWFARGRAAALGLAAAVPDPRERICEKCGSAFLECSIRPSLTDRVGLDALVFCGPCMASFLYLRSGDEEASREDVLAYARAITAALGKVPRQDFGEHLGDLTSLPLAHRLRVLRALAARPSVRCIKSHFSSWKAALAAAGISSRQ